MSIANTFRAWLRRKAEHVARRFYEGPDAPPRLFEEVEIFESLHPRATPEQWRDFVLGSVRNAYRDGYIRGYEHRERMPRDEGYDAMQAASEGQQDWSIWQGSPTTEELRRRFEEQRLDPFAHLPPEQRAAAIAELGQFEGTYRVVWGDDPMPWRKNSDAEP